jgi:putative adenylate-forming enzyme
MAFLQSCFDLSVAAHAFVRSRVLAGKLKSRADIDRWQQGRIATWLKRSVAQCAFYENLRPERLADLPTVDKQVVMDQFDRFNAPGITRAQGWQYFDSRSHPPGYTIGASTGTSGNRGLYVISNRERFEWLGVMLGKTLPRFPLETARIAVILPLDTPLYQAANRGRRLQLRFFDLNDGLETLPAKITDYKPDTLIAPPKVLRFLAEQDVKTAPKRLFSAAEVLDPLDRTIIERHFNTRLREIYMATEGLLGVSCERGNLHLVEDVVHFEFENGPAGSGLSIPIISDFTRRTQIMARYRLNDLLRLSSAPCECGSPLQCVEEVVGRSDDILLLPGKAGKGLRSVTPDIIRNAIVRAHSSIDDFRCVQSGRAQLDITLPVHVPQLAIERVAQSIAGLLDRLDVAAKVAVSAAALDPPIIKLRRVSRTWKADDA